MTTGRINQISIVQGSVERKIFLSAEPSKEFSSASASQRGRGASAFFASLLAIDIYIIYIKAAAGARQSRTLVRARPAVSVTAPVSL